MASFLAIVFTEVQGSFEGAAAMGGVTVGLPLGGVLGFVLTLWLVLRLWKPAPRTVAGDKHST